MKRGKGQPTKYRPEYCELLIKHMSDGFSFESFAAVVNVDRDTIYEWAKVNENFSDAKKKAQMKGLLYDEKILQMLTQGEFGKTASAASHIFKMKCKHRHVGWNDTEAVASVVKDGDKLIIKLNEDK